MFEGKGGFLFFFSSAKWPETFLSNKLCVCMYYICEVNMSVPVS